VVKSLICECGFEARATDEEGLVSAVRRHALEAHGMALTRDDVLMLASRAEPSDDLPPTTPHCNTNRSEEE
jgi:predicted small metal-binding protein